MIRYAQALEQILQASPAAVVERCAASMAMKRVLAAPVSSPQALPPFDNAALDGYALPAGDFPAGAEFAVQGRHAAGGGIVAATGDAVWEVTTGAHMPRGLSTVAPLEQVEVLSHDIAGEPARIRLRSPAWHSRHVRRIGEDVAAGKKVLGASTWVREQQSMLLSALGIAHVDVAQRPRVAVISTGRELVDDPAQPLGDGQIRNANGPYLHARTMAAGAELVHSETVTDEAAAWHGAMRRAAAAGAEVIVSTGAVSCGRHDFVPAALAEQGAQVLFRTVAIRPGKPLLFARLSSGALYFGLPGNPAACAVGWRFFVEPALRAMLGLPPEAACRLPLAVASCGHRAGLRHHLKGRVAMGADGRCTVSALAGQESFRILPLAQANAWLVLPEENTDPRVGEAVQVHSLGHEQPLIGTGA